MLLIADGVLSHMDNDADLDAAEVSGSTGAARSPGPTG